MDVRSGERAATDDNLFNLYNLFTLQKNIMLLNWHPWLNFSRPQFHVIIFKHS